MDFPSFTISPHFVAELSNLVKVTKTPTKLEASMIYLMLLLHLMKLFKLSHDAACARHETL